MSRRPLPKWLQAARSQPQTARASGSQDWLGRALPRAGVLAFRPAEQAIHSGRVTVNGQLVRDPFAAVVRGDRVAVDQREVSLDAVTRVLMFHKPAGVVTAGSDPEGQGTVFEALEKVLGTELSSFGWHAVGRLDRQTTGLLLFSNDERFVAHATAPATHLPKTYVAVVDGAVQDDQIRMLAAGVVLDDGPAVPVSVRKRAANVVEIVLDEGRHHQVRRMLNAVHLATRALAREAIGDLGLDVPAGAVRELTKQEVGEKLNYAPAAEIEGSGAVASPGGAPV